MKWLAGWQASANSRASDGLGQAWKGRGRYGTEIRSLLRLGNTRLTCLPRDPTMVLRGKDSLATGTLKPVRILIIYCYSPGQYY